MSSTSISRKASPLSPVRQERERASSSQAIGLLLGNRADAKAIKPGEKKCVIEAQFNISGYKLKELFDENDADYDENECIIRRELSANGKSRAFVNDSPACCCSSARWAAVWWIYTPNTRTCCFRKRISNSVSWTS